MKLFRDLEQVRNDMKMAMPLDQFIELADGKSLERVHDDLYKKSCDLDEHPMDDDGSRDSTASFTVAPSKELWYCFGCGAGGDRFEYMSRKEHVDHIEAIHRASKIMGFDLSPYYQDMTPEEQMMQSLFSENAQAREIAHQQLLSNQRALDYLLGRGISMDSITELKLGYAPPMPFDRIEMFDTIPNRLALQLDRKGQFNDAILFPINDPYGRMRYFQSRPFNPLDGMKYIGGDDTHPLYDDIDRFFGFDRARKMLRQTGGVIVGVEGGPDAIACQQAGIAAFGVLGTVVNQGTMDMMDRYRVQYLILLLDGDKAGRDRSKKIAEKFMSLKTNVRLKIATMPEDLDPDEFINKYGPNALREVIDNAVYAVQFLIDNTWDEMNTNTPTAKIDFIWKVKDYVVAVSDPFMKKILIHHIAGKIGFDPVEIEDYYLSASVMDSGISLYSPEGEEILLGEAIRNPEFALDLATKFDESDWYLTRHRNLFGIIKTGKYADTETIFTTVRNMGMEKIITRQWLDSIAGNVGDVEFYMQDVEDKLIRRKAKDKLKKMDVALSDMSKNPSITIDQSMGEIYNATIKQSDNSVVNASQQVSSVMNLIHERMKNPGQIIGTDLGPNFKRLTQALLGLQTKTLTIVAANQSVGKTQIAENWAMHIAPELQEGCLWISLEMDSDRMTFRNLSILSGIPLTPLLTGNITVEDKMQKLDPVAIKLANAPFYLSERGHDLAESLAIARRYVMRHKVKWIFVDYLQLQYVSGRYGVERHRELGIISKAWKQFAKEMDVGVIGISQLSKQALDATVAKAEHGAGSYEIAQDSDNYITLKEKDEQEIAEQGIERGNIVMNLDKNRMGDADVLINVYSERATQRMKEV